MKLRPYQPSDLATVQAFIGQCLRHDAFRNYHPGDVLHWMSSEYRGKSLSEHFWLCEARGKLLALAELPSAAAASYVLIVHPRHRGGDLETALLLECQSVMERRMSEANAEKTSLSVNVITTDRARIRCLTNLGYQAKASTTAVSSRSLKTPVPAPVLPAGFTLRSVAGEHEVALSAEVHNGSFGSSWSAQGYLEVMRTPGFEPERELVVVAPDGRFAAFLVYWLDPLSESALLEPVGCHADFRRRGLTKALMLEALRRMAAAGMKTALVGHRTDNAAAVGLYAAVGFAEHFRTLDYSLAVA